jgi:4'-phosphopantetheinyl transferase EntD
MMEELLPPGVVVAEHWDDDESAFLLPEERAQVAKAVEKRVREFTTARNCARQALGKLGFTPVPILCGSKGEPLWPLGVVGSITHCAGYRAAAVAMQADLAAIGIDAEIHEPLPPEVVSSICVVEETAWLREASEQLHWDRILFSAKESVYKAWFPLTHRWLGFEEVAITVDAAEGAFRVRPLVSLPRDFDQALRHFAGRFLVLNGLVITAVVLPRTT